MSTTNIEEQVISKSGGAESEAHAGADAEATSSVKERIEEQQEMIETIVPNKEHRSWTLGKGKEANTYVQKPLGYMNKLEFFALLGETIDRAMSGDQGLTVTGMLNQVGIRDGSLTLNDFRDPDVFVQGITKLITFAPDLMDRCHCIWLNIPPGDRPWAVQMMRQSPDDGGLSDDDGFQILETFLDQNMEAMEGFFAERIPKLARRAKGLSKRLGKSQS